MTKKKQKVDWKVQLGAIVTIGAIEIYAISQGMNGYMLATVIGIIAYLAGLKTPTPNAIK